MGHGVREGPWALKTEQSKFEILVLPFISSVTMSKSGDVSESQFPHFQNEDYDTYAGLLL